MTIKSAIQFHSLVSRWLGEGGRPVSQQQAQARADVCLKCPQNVEKPIEELLKDAVALTVRRQIELKNNMRLRVEGEKSLHLCMACGGCVNRLKIWSPIKFILQNTGDVTFSRLDKLCWILSEKGNP